MWVHLRNANRLLQEVQLAIQRGSEASLHQSCRWIGISFKMPVYSMGLEQALVYSGAVRGKMPGPAKGACSQFTMSIFGKL